MTDSMRVYRLTGESVPEATATASLERWLTPAGLAIVRTFEDPRAALAMDARAHVSGQTSGDDG